MQQRKSRAFSATCLMFGLLAVPASAAAQDQASVIIMKFANQDANADVVAAVEADLAASVEAHPELSVEPGGGQMTITDLALTAGCSNPDAACMKQLRGFLQGDRIIFGTVVGEEGGHSFSFKMFDFEADAFVSSQDGVRVSGEPAEVVQIVPAVADGFLFGNVGELTVGITGGATDLSVSVDGNQVGTAPGTIEGLPLGQHTVAVRGPSGAEQLESVVMYRGAPTVVEFTFAPDDVDSTSKPTGGGGSPVPGIVSIGVGVLGIGLGAFSSLQVDKANSDNQRLGDEGFVDPDAGAFNSPEAAAQAEAAGLNPSDIEKRGKMFQTLQFVGYGVGAVGVGVGIYLLAKSMGGGESDDATALPFEFDVSPTRDGVAASFRARF